MNKMFKNILSVITGIVMAANIAAVPVLAEGEQVTTDVTLYESYNHFMDGNQSQSGYGYTVLLNGTAGQNVNSQYFVTNGNNKRFTYVNFEIPQMSSDKLLKAELKLTPHTIAGGTITIYGRHIPTSTWRNGFYGSPMDKVTTVDDEGTSATTFHNQVYTATNEGINKITPTTLGTLNASELTAGTAVSIDVTEYLKQQIAAGVKHIDINGTTGGHMLFYGNNTTDVTDAQKPQIVLTVDTTNVDEQLAALTASGFKAFVNNYYSYYGIDYKIVKRINTLSDRAAGVVFEKIADTDKTKDGFAEAVEAAFEALKSNTVESAAASNVWIDQNNNATKVVKNSGTMYYVPSQGRLGAFEIPLPTVDAAAVKSVKLVVNTTADTTATSSIVVDYSNIDISTITSSTDLESLNAVKLPMMAGHTHVPNTKMTLTAKTAAEYEYDVTDYILEAIANGKTKMNMSVGIPGSWSASNVALNTSSSKQPKLVFELEYESVVDEFLKLDNADALHAFLTDSENASKVGVDVTEYNKFSYPIYLAEYIIEKGYSSVEEFNTALAEAAAEYTEIVTVNKNKLIHYRTGETTSGVSQGLRVNPGSLGVYYLNGYAFVLYDMPRMNKIMGGTMTAERQSTSINSRNSDMAGYTSVAPESIPTEGSYAVDSDEANAWISYADGGAFVDGTATFNFETYNEDASSTSGKTYTTTATPVAISDTMTAELNKAVGENGSDYFAIRFASSNTNIYYTDIVLNLKTDKTEELYIKETTENAILSMTDSASLAQYLDEMTEKQCEVIDLDLSEYKMFAARTYVAEGALGAATFDEFKEKLASSIEANKISMTLTADKLVTYATKAPSDGAPMKVGLNVGVNNASPNYGNVYAMYDLSEVPAVFGGTMYDSRAQLQDNVRQQKIVRFSVVNPKLPANNLYEIDSDEATAFNTWQTDSASFITDGTTKFTFDIKTEDGTKYGYSSSEINVTDALISAMNSAIAEGGSDTLAIELGHMDNVYTTGITFNLVVDGTAIKAREEEFVGILNTVLDSGAADSLTLLTMFADYDDVLKLSENVEYKLIDKSAVAQAVIDNKPEYGYESADAVKAVINAKIAELAAAYYEKFPVAVKGVSNTDGDVTVNVLKNAEADGAVIITAAYDSQGTFIGVKSTTSTELDNAATGSTVSVTISDTGFEAGTVIKGFVWESISSMRPLSN